VGAPGTSPDASWDPSAPLSLEAFLDREVPDLPAERIALVPWRPALALCGRACLALLEAAAAYIKRADANYRTAAYFSARWEKNFFRNITLVKNVYYPKKVKRPIVAAAAGPSLEGVLPLLREKRGGIFLLAASAAGPTLAAGGLKPDMLIACDGGAWALAHLRECCRCFPALPPLAFSMTASLPSQAAEAPLLPLADTGPWQGRVLEALGIPFAALPQRGTVAASAIDLALLLSPEAVYFCGMDLAPRGIASHARGYPLDALAEQGASRLAPLYSGAFCRARALSRGGSMGVYVDWFKREAAAWPARVHSLGDNHPIFAGRSAGKQP
jgi:hypothetical protein